MLRSEYDKTIVGLNYISLIHGIVALKKETSVLLIDNNEDANENNWIQYMGDLEKNLFKLLGEEHEIGCLKNIDQYLKPRHTLLVLDDIYLELSYSPFTNITEIARKIPGSLTQEFLSEVKSLGQVKFDQKMKDLTKQIVAKSDSLFHKKEMKNLFESQDSLISKYFDSFIKYLNQDSTQTKQLHNLLQMKFQTVFSSAVDELETKFLLFSLISPRYSASGDTLKNELLYEFRKLGGDLKGTTIQDWGIEKSQLNFILLASIDGVIKTGECFYFSPLRYHAKFHNKINNKRFLSIKIDCLIDHEYIEFFCDKRILFSHKNRMGSDFPFWEVFVDSMGNLRATYAYADTVGTKASFHYTNALDDIYQSLLEVFPGLNREDWVSRAKTYKSNDVWLEYDPDQKSKLAPDHKFLLNSIYLKDSNQQIDNFYFCGFERSKSLGLYSYLLDIFSRN